MQLIVNRYPLSVIRKLLVAVCEEGFGFGFGNNENILSKMQLCSKKVPVKTLPVDTLHTRTPTINE